MKNVFVLLAVATTVSFAAAVRVAGSAGTSRPMPDSGQPVAIEGRQPATDIPEDTTVMSYDDGTIANWWCSDRAQFGAAVKFTPAQYPCLVVGTRSIVGYEPTAGQNIYLRVYDDDGSGGLPGTVLDEEHRTDVPPGHTGGFQNYNLATPVTITSGDFYICWWQKATWDLYFTTDQHLDYPSREWWYFPDMGWVTPMGMDAADQLIRARVIYPCGAFSLLTPTTGAGDQPVTGITFDWGDASNVNTYSLYLSTNPANPPAGPPLVSGLTSSTWTHSGTPLLNGTHYYWNVKAANSVGSRWSTNGNFDFTTIVAAPLAFNLLLPENDATDVPLTGDLTWQASGNATNYDVYLGTTTPPPLYQADVGNVTTYPYTVTEYNRRYYWAVVARNSGPTSTRCSQDFDFTTQASVSPGWTPKSPMPPGTKPIKDGGWLAYDAGTARIYASRGNKQPSFFSYIPANDSWKVLAPWLSGTEGKLPSKGSAGCADGNGHVYATKGNNKSGFWKYSADGDSWTQKKDVPLGLSNKKVKGGTDITWALKGSTGSPYLLKGYKNEFYRYDTGGDSWQTLTPAPIGSNVKWDKGSWLAYDDVNKKIYAHKAKYHEFYRYSPDGDSWSGLLAGMPMTGSAGNKKAKDGSCGTYTNGRIYAFKGGNTREFWQYTIAGNVWAEKETIPTGTLKKKVKAGADIVAVGTVMYATKGNKTNELWQYVPSSFLFEAPQHDGITAERVANSEWRIAITPNPLASGFATVNLSPSASRKSPLTLTVCDVSGRLVYSSFGLRTSSFRLDLRSTPAGVYLVRVEADGFSATQKLVVQR